MLKPILILGFVVHVLITNIKNMLIYLVDSNRIPAQSQAHSVLHPAFNKNAHHNNSSQLELLLNQGEVICCYR